MHTSDNIGFVGKRRDEEKNVIDVIPNTKRSEMKKELSSKKIAKKSNLSTLLNHQCVCTFTYCDQSRPHKQ